MKDGDGCILQRDFTAANAAYLNNRMNRIVSLSGHSRLCVRYGVRIREYVAPGI